MHDCHHRYHRCPALPDLELLEASALTGCSWYLTRSVWIVPRTWEGEVLCHQQRYQLGPGRALYVDSHDVFQSLRVTRPGRLSAIFIDSRPSRAGEVDGLAKPRSLAVQLAGAVERRSGPLERFEALREAILSGSSAGELSAHRHGLSEMAERACPELLRCRRPVRPSAGIATRLRAWIDADCRREQSLAMCAEQLGVTRFQALRAFKQSFGVTPSAYQMCLRLAGACDALRSGATPAEVAADYGFSDQSHLGRHFKRGLGVSPGQYARAFTTETSYGAGVRILR